LDRQFVIARLPAIVAAVLVLAGVAPLRVCAQASIDLNVSTSSERYTLIARRLEDRAIELNGKPLRLTSGGDLPQLNGEPAKAGAVRFAPISITYLSIANAGNTNCQ
jgi:hypothetical protein